MGERVEVAWSWSVGAIEVYYWLLRNIIISSGACLLPIGHDRSGIEFVLGRGESWGHFVKNCFPYLNINLLFYCSIGCIAFPLDEAAFLVREAIVRIRHWLETITVCGNHWITVYACHLLIASCAGLVVMRGYCLMIVAHSRQLLMFSTILVSAY
jgi:hypothetical protein